MRLLQGKWLVVGTVAVNAFIIAGASAAVTGTLFGTLMGEFGWSNSRTSSLATAYTVGFLVTTPAVGMALDRLSPRTVMAFGAGCTSVAFVCMAHCHSWWAMMGAFAMAGVGYSGGFYLPSAVVVTTWMRNRRSLGMGFVMGAMSAGAAVLSPLTSWLSQLLGWRVVVQGGAALIASVLPLIWWGVVAHGASEPRQPILHAEQLGFKGAQKELLSCAFMLIAASGVLSSVDVQGIYFQIVSLLSKAGYSPQFAGVAFGGTWVLSALGSLAFGILADRFGARRILGGAMLCCSIGTLSLIGIGVREVGEVCVVIFVIFWGVSSNSFLQLSPVIIAERFGPDYQGTLVGVLSAAIAVAGALAPLLTGLLFDMWGDHGVVPIANSSLALIACVLVLLVKVPGSRELRVGG